MNFQDTNEPEQPKPVLPDLRTFRVRRFEPLKLAQGRHEIEEMMVQSHTMMVEEDGSLSFIMFTVGHGQVMPQRHQLFHSYIDVVEEAAFTSSRILH